METYYQLFCLSFFEKINPHRNSQSFSMKLVIKTTGSYRQLHRSGKVNNHSQHIVSSLTNLPSQQIKCVCARLFQSKVCATPIFCREGRRFEDRGQRTEVRGQTSDLRLPISDFRPPISDLRLRYASLLR